MRSKQIDWKIELQTSVPPIVKAGRIALAYQVLNNLVSNAIKFTPEGGSIKVSIQDLPEAWRLSVEDSGIGIPSDLLGRLFDSDKPTTRLGTGGEKGTGFGMPIVKMFVEKYQGTVEVESKPVGLYPEGHGTKDFNSTAEGGNH